MAATGCFFLCLKSYNHYFIFCVCVWSLFPTNKPKLALRTQSNWCSIFKHIWKNGQRWGKQEFNMVAMQPFHALAAMALCFLDSQPGRLSCYSVRKYWVRPRLSLLLSHYASADKQHRSSGQEIWHIFVINQLSKYGTIT
jgi:hypothetical protein